MLGGVAVLRLVAAAHVAAHQAHAQVYPLVAGLHAFFAAVGVGVMRVNLVECSHCSLMAAS
ncbi:conserved hypothetical protein, partial [Ricinus communis]